MVNVIIFAPAADQLSYVQGLVHTMQTEEVHITAVHHFGNPEVLEHLDNYDAILARGITYRMVCARYPEKHIAHLDFDGTDILEALLECRDTFHPKRIGICLKRDELQSLLPGLSELSHAEVRLYDVVDEQSAYTAVDACQRDGVDAIVAGGTVSNICAEREIPCTYIHIRPATLKRAVQDVLQAAKSINTKRTHSNMIRMILDGSDHAVLAVDETGLVLEANDLAYRLYRLAFHQGWQGSPVNLIHPELTYIGSRDDPCQDGTERTLVLNEQKYVVHYQLVAGEMPGVGTLITTTAASKYASDESGTHKNLLRKGLTARYTFRDIIAVSPEMKKKVEIAKKFAQVRSNVLITGATGTGKELFAHSIHAASSRMEQPFVAINCANLPETLLESEMFGYEPGSFSGASRGGKTGLFELANHGTIFLDEIGEIPVSLQAKLLRVLQAKEIRRIGSTSVIPIDVRVIAATNVNIHEQIAAGHFRSDLLYRLNTLELHIPPLCERPDDIIPLMEGHLRIVAAELGKKAPQLTAEAKELLRSYAWAGNVRELRNICERLVVLSDSSDVSAASLHEFHVFSAPPAVTPSAPTAPSPTPQLVAQSASLLPPAPKKKKDIARELGVSRTTLWRMTKRQKEAEEREKNPR